MKHPNQATLALHAGGDLGPLARWRTERHLARCGRCREEMEAFDQVREMLPELAETPEISWNRLAAEMRANIRLGLAAGECVRSSRTPWRDVPFFAGARALVAVASVVVLVAAGLMLERPAPGTTNYTGYAGTEVQAIRDGIQVRQGGQSLGLMHSGAQSVIHSVGADGSMRVRFVDPETGYVTINNVNAD